MLAIFQKLGVINSLEDWQTARTVRNLAAHDYETDYRLVAEHFNALHALKPDLWQVSARFVRYCESELHVHPSSADFAAEFSAITSL